MCNFSTLRLSSCMFSPPPTFKGKTCLHHHIGYHSIEHCYGWIEGASHIMTEVESWQRRGSSFLWMAPAIIDSSSCHGESGWMPASITSADMSHPVNLWYVEMFKMCLLKPCQRLVWRFVALPKQSRSGGLRNGLRWACLYKPSTSFGKAGLF